MILFLEVSYCYYSLIMDSDLDIIKIITLSYSIFMIHDSPARRASSF